MEKKKGRKKKIRFNYFLKKKIIIGICLFLVFVVGIATVLVITNKEDKELESNQNEVEKVIPAKCPYTLDEIEEAITSGWLFSPTGWSDYGEEANEMAYVLFHFYEYFNKETKFTVWNELDTKNGEILSYKKISYEDYMKYRNGYLKSATRKKDAGNDSLCYVSSLRDMMFMYVKLV